MSESEQPERRIILHEVIKASVLWTEQAHKKPSEFSMHLTLDDGTEEIIVEIAAGDLGPLLQLFDRSAYASFDVERRRLLFRNFYTK